jgi:hypothetical protein
MMRTASKAVRRHDMATTDRAVSEAIAAHPAWQRLEDQRSYYSGRAGAYQTRYKRIKLTLIALASSIPLLAFLPAVGGALADYSKWLVAAAGVLIAVLEGVLLLNQYGALWVQYRGTAECLKRERWLLLSRAGDYRGLDDADALQLLAERTEALLEVEHREWTQEQKQALAQLADQRKWLAERAATVGAAPGSGSAP